MRARKRIKRIGEFALVEALRRTARALPRPVGPAVFAALGAAAGRLRVRDRRRAADNLAAAFPRMPAPVREATVRAMYRALGRNAWEFLALEGAPPEAVRARVARVDGAEHVEAARAAGRGFVAVTGHIGCWELMAAYFAATGLDVSVVARRLRIERLNRRLVAIRASVGVRTLDRDAGARPMIEALRRGGALGVLIDQHTRVAGAYVPFFGRPAHTPTAVARLAMLTGAPIVPMANYRLRDGRYAIRVLPPIEARPVRGDRRRRHDEVVRVTAACSAALEELVRHDPTQWVWFHDRWRGTPEAVSADAMEA